MPLSQHPALPYTSTLFSAIFLSFGATYMLSPRTGYSLYGFSTAPTTAADWAVMQRVMVLYGAKDVFMAAAIASATWFGTRRSAGLVMVAAALCAAVDGYVVKAEAGTGEWAHWGYGGIIGLVGLVMAGLLG